MRLYVAVVIPTLTYGCTAWLFTDNIKQKVNGVNSKMLATITKRSIHEEANEPTYNAVECMLQRQLNYLGHTFRLAEDRILCRVLLELSPRRCPFIPGSLLDDTDYDDVESMTRLAMKKDGWKRSFRKRPEQQGV